jgi:hypothetical protein
MARGVLANKPKWRLFSEESLLTRGKACAAWQASMKTTFFPRIEAMTSRSWSFDPT